MQNLKSSGHPTLILAFLAGSLLGIGLKEFLSFVTRNSHEWRNLLSANPKRSYHTNGNTEGRSECDSVEPFRRNNLIGEGIEACIGNTPLFLIRSLSQETNCRILAKAEFLNGAGGSTKDRVALNIIQEAESKGLIKPNSGDIVYEGSVGSTGISLASICNARGYKAYICMPNDQATEKSELLVQLGAVVERVEPAPIVDQEHFVNKAKNLATKHTNSGKNPSRGFFANQFEATANWRAHFNGTGPEIYKQTNGKLDAFVVGAGTGGTITGVARYLKPRIPALKVVLADPQGSGLLNKVKFGVMFDVLEKEGTKRRPQTDSLVEGIGINRLTKNFEVGQNLIDDAIRVTDFQAFKMARWLVENDGLFVGGSSAVNCVAAVQLAKSLGPGRTIVTILCDAGTRHMSRFWARASELEANVAKTLSQVLEA